MSSAATRIALITGANTGLGLETVRQLYTSANSAYTILLGGRSLDKAKEAAKSVETQFGSSTKSTVVPVQIDISDDQSIKALHDTVEKTYGKLDVLINNGGSQYDPQIFAGKMDVRKGWQETFNVNVTSTYVMTYEFADLLIKSSDARLIFIASGTSSLEEASQGLPKMGPPTEPGWPKPIIGGLPSYRSSKAATNMMMLEWNRIFAQDENVKVFAVSPGMLATGLGGIGAEKLKQMGAEEPAVGAAFLRDVAEGKRDELQGKVFRRQAVQPW